MRCARKVIRLCLALTLWWGSYPVSGQSAFVGVLPLSDGIQLRWAVVSLWSVLCAVMYFSHVLVSIRTCAPMVFCRLCTLLRCMTSLVFMIILFARCLDIFCWRT